MTASTKQHRSIVDMLAGSAWPALLVLWVALAAAWLMIARKPDSLWPAALLVAWLGLTAGGALSERVGWWWTGFVSMTLGLAGGAVVGWLTQAYYPASDLAWVPFTAGASLRWQYGAAVAVLGVAVSVAVRPSVQGSGLARAALLSLLAIFYLFRGPFPATRDEVPMGLIVLTLVVIAVGAADHVAPRIAASRLAHQIAVVTVSLAGLLMAAGGFWRFILLRPIDPFIWFGERHVNNVLPVATLAVVAGLAVVIGVRAASRQRRLFDGGHLAPSPIGSRALWLHAKQEPIFWVVFGGSLGAIAGRTTAQLVERFDWLFVIAGAGAGVGLALAIWTALDRHQAAASPQSADEIPPHNGRPSS